MGCLGCWGRQNTAWKSRLGWWYQKSFGPVESHHEGLSRLGWTTVFSGPTEQVVGSRPISDRLVFRLSRSLRTELGKWPFARFIAYFCNVSLWAILFLTFVTATKLFTVHLRLSCYHLKSLIRLDWQKNRKAKRVLMDSTHSFPH